MAKRNGIAAKADVTEIEESAVKGQGLPLFFQKPAAVEKARHAAAGVDSRVGLHFARQTNSVALNALEFIEAAKHYPIVFTPGEAPVALAVLGLEQDNYFVDDTGRWREDCYVPAYVRQYPFIFFEDEAAKRLVLCIDERSPHFCSEAGEGAHKLFNADGSATPIINQALEFCTSYRRHHLATLAMAADLKKHQLLTPYHSQMTTKTGKKLELGGFLMIDEAAFNTLPEAVFLEFRTKGWLPFIYLALTSASNWKRLSKLADA